MPLGSTKHLQQENGPEVAVWAAPAGCCGGVAAQPSEAKCRVQRDQLAAAALLACAPPAPGHAATYLFSAPAWCRQIGAARWVFKLAEPCWLGGSQSQHHSALVGTWKRMQAFQNPAQPCSLPTWHPRQLGDPTWHLGQSKLAYMRPHHARPFALTVRAECPFAHPAEKAKRRDPRIFNYTGIACPSMKKVS